MYEKFIAANAREKILPNNGAGIQNKSVKLLFEECGGCNFRNGLYKVHNAESSIYWLSLIRKIFPAFTGNITPFAYDWMGQQFALDRDRQDLITVFDPATIEYFQIRQNLDEMHNIMLVSARDRMLSEEFFLKLLSHIGKDKIGYKECIGHKKPLFLGGTEEDSNYQVTDLEVYWEFQNQIYQQIKHLPPGTNINSVQFLPKK